MQIYGEYPISDLCQTDNILLASNDYHKNAEKILHVIIFPMEQKFPIQQKLKMLKDTNWRNWVV